MRVLKAERNELLRRNVLGRAYRKDGFNAEFSFDFRQTARE